MERAQFRISGLSENKENVFSLRSYIERYKSEDVLTHIDAVPDNFYSQQILTVTKISA